MLKITVKTWTIGIALSFLVTVIPKAYTKTNIEIIAIENVNVSTKITGLKTYDGLSIKVRMIKNLRNKFKANAQKILDNPQIELISGEIIYPEEIRFFYKSKRTLSIKDAYKKSKKNFRAPEGDD